jgi:replicative DNA helicase
MNVPSIGKAGAPTGFTDLDLLTGGLQPETLVVIGGRSSTGKTALALNIGKQIAKLPGATVGVISLETTKDATFQRLLAAESLVEPRRLMAQFMTEGDWTRVAGAFGSLTDCNLLVDDAKGARVNAEYVVRRAQRLANSPGPALLIVDYLQLVEHDEPDELRYFLNSLKTIARELKICVLVTSQLGRVTRADPRPYLDDFRHGEGEAADQIMMLHLPYRFEDVGESEDFVAELHLAKNRFGHNGLIRLAFLPTESRFGNLES